VNDVQARGKCETGSVATVAVVEMEDAIQKDSMRAEVVGASDALSDAAVMSEKGSSATVGAGGTDTCGKAPKSSIVIAAAARTAAAGDAAPVNEAAGNEAAGNEAAGVAVISRHLTTTLSPSHSDTHNHYYHNSH
jgi:hypothetical protein